MRLALSILCFVTLASTALADPAATAGSKGDDVQPAECEKAAATKLPVPDPAVKVAKDCDSQALYYGIGRRADPAAARACAFSHLDASDDPMDGAGMLATIYANGKGVSRNYAIAIAFACRMDGAPAEMSGRLAHLAALKTNGPGKSPFDICDDITSGQMMGFCAQRTSDIAAMARDAKLATLTRGLDGARKAAYAKLRTAEAAYVTAVSDNEVDLSGTGRTAFALEAADEHHDAFASTLEAALAGDLPADASPDAAFAAADTRLNTTYAKVMAMKDVSALGTVDKAGIKATQRAWLAYRNAFAAFADGSPTPPLTVQTVLTEQRTKDLADFVN